MNIVGLGKAGCAIADCFAKYPQYNTYKLDVGLKRTKNSFPIVERATHEEYDKREPKIKKFVSEMESSEKAVFVMAGSGTITGASLRILQKLHEAHEELHVLYIKPDHTLLNGLGLLQDRACYRLNDLLVGVLHWVNIFQNTEPVVNTHGQLEETVRIYTLGTLDVESGEQKLFFPLNSPADKCYYYGINKEDLETNGKLFKDIKKRVRDSAQAEEANISYSIHPTSYGDNFCYLTAHSSEIQIFPEKTLDT